MRLYHFPQSHGILVGQWVHPNAVDSYVDELVFIVHFFLLDFGQILVPKAPQLVPQCRARFVTNEGHFSLPVNHAEEILATLLDSTA